MEMKVLKRSEVNTNETWDLTRLFKTEEDYEKALFELSKKVENFEKKYKDNLNTPDIINSALDDYRDISICITYVNLYADLNASSDQTDEKNAVRFGKFSIYYSDLSKKLVFFLSELKSLDIKLLEDAKNSSTENKLFLEKIIKKLPHKISKEVKQALGEFRQTLDSSYRNYIKFKLSDMKFNNFIADGKEHEMSFTLFENGWQNNSNAEIRRAAFENFYKKLGEYENGLANNYAAHVLKEKAYANLKNFDNVISYLLDKQDVTEDLYNRQIDIIMEKLSVPMRKYANLLKEIHGLDKITYADLHLAVDPEFEPSITIAESKKYAIDGLSILGPEYTLMVEKSYNERWIDFPQSLGKSTGGFCDSPYQKGSYILLNWNNEMNEVFVLAHELGHAGHFYFAGANQNFFNTEASLYFIEAPSTMNEIIMADHLKSQNKDPRFLRFVLSNIISRTYYHNCVTHLLEAHYQREVYRLVESKQPITANVLNNLKLDTLRQFWGDTVEIPDWAGRTWIRQPHYFMGLYPYTYSAGLTIATSAYKKIKSGEISVETWLDVLKAGNTKSPVELAKMVNVDLTTEKPLLEMIDFVSQMINEVIDLTKELD
ncbi:MAG: oligoendopeptidase F [Defluviitaleaceae bacterium]|nr:oligoendopeptidase F [Defluviitaleaceae bacterium]